MFILYQIGFLVFKGFLNLSEHTAMFSKFAGHADARDPLLSAVERPHAQEAAAHLLGDCSQSECTGQTAAGDDPRVRRLSQGLAASQRVRQRIHSQVTFFLVIFFKEI